MVARAAAGAAAAATAVDATVCRGAGVVAVAATGWVVGTAAVLGAGVGSGWEG